MNSKYYKISLKRYGRNLSSVALSDGRRIPIYCRIIEDQDELVFEDLVLGMKIYDSYEIKEGTTLGEIKQEYKKKKFLQYDRYHSVQENVSNLKKIKEILDSLTDDDVKVYFEQIDNVRNNIKTWFLNVIKTRQIMDYNEKEIKNLKEAIDNYKPKSK